MEVETGDDLEQALKMHKRDMGSRLVEGVEGVEGRGWWGMDVVLAA